MANKKGKQKMGLKREACHDQKDCIMCGKIFYVRKEGMRTRSTSFPVRQRRSKTCSKICSLKFKRSTNG